MEAANPLGIARLRRSAVLDNPPRWRTMNLGMSQGVEATPMAQASSRYVGRNSSDANPKSQAMPYYDYQCSQWRRKFTLQQTFKEHVWRKRVKCSKCGTQEVERVIC